MSDQMAKDHAKDYKRERALRDLARDLRVELAWLKEHTHRPGRLETIQAALSQVEKDAASIVAVWD